MQERAMSRVWNTKYGSRRVKENPPTLEEAIIAAQGLTDNLQEQAEIAASLMQLPFDKVKVEVVKAGAQRKTVQTVTMAGRDHSPRSVVVEPRAPRRSIG